MCKQPRQASLIHRVETGALFIVMLLIAAGSVFAQTAQSVDSSIKTFGIEINVDDMDKALAFYTGKLGFEVEDRQGYPDYIILKTGDREKLILNRVNKLSKPGPNDSNLSFTLQVNDLAETIERMKKLGVEFAEKAPRKEAVGNAISIRDPFGRSISLMHETIVKVDPFAEPKLYNFGFLISDMQAARDFYVNKIGFVVRSERYLPLDLPLGHGDKTFAFMLHVRPGVVAGKSTYPNSVAYNTAVFATFNLPAALERLKANGVKIVDTKEEVGKRAFVMLEDPFGIVSKLLEVKTREP